ncbi:hypothetical protein CR513_54963, partial [Mucuna pruriens]
MKLENPIRIQPGASNFNLVIASNKPNIGNKSSFYAQPTKPFSSKAPRIYSVVEMADRRAKSLCIFCDENP